MGSDILLSITKVIGKIRTPSAFLISTLILISISWLADGFAEIIQQHVSSIISVICIAIPVVLSIVSVELTLKIVSYFKKGQDFQILKFLSPLIILILIYFLVLPNFIPINKDYIYSAFKASFGLTNLYVGWKLIRDFVTKTKFSVRSIDIQEYKPKALIIFLSNIGNLKDIEEIFRSQSKKHLNEIFENKKIPWEMPIRIIDKFKDSLKYIYIIPSKESYEQVNCFKELIGMVEEFASCKENIEIMTHERGINFEDLKENIEVIEEIYEKLISDKKIKPNDILIDITGGQKIQSAAGSFSSLAYDRYFCYISTNTKEIKVFDVTNYQSE